ncbi:MAG: phosphoribosylglycinamide formyltransferase [Kiritimatiellae bacterium]|nr:phosphoribosylglycinamide formyltransferase [Kiritimatiellia bacterium]
MSTLSTPRLKIAVLGSGSGSNCQSIIDAIRDGQLHAEIVCIISDVEDAFILERARQHDLPAQYVSAAPFKTKLDADAEQAYIKIMQDAGAEVIVLAGFMRIIKKGLLQAFDGRILNIHPSLLPSFPGLHAWKQALNYGVKVTGCTVHFVDEGTDTGPIIIQRSVPVLDDDTAESLHARIQVQEHLAYTEALRYMVDKCLHKEGRRVTVCTP